MAQLDSLISIAEWSISQECGEMFEGSPCILAYEYMHVWIYEYCTWFTSIYVYANILICSYTCIYICIYMYIYVYHMYIENMHTYSYSYTYISSYTWILYTHIYMYIYMYVCMNKYTWKSNDFFFKYLETLDKNP
jgi:hypothetical protein